MSKRQFKELSKAQKSYLNVFKKDAPSRYKNDVDWLNKKVKEIEEANASAVNLSKKDSDGGSSSSTSAKKQKVEEKKILTFSNLLSKTTTYKDWIAFKKLLNNASDEEKDEFYKKAKGLAGGKPPYYSLEKVKQRLAEKEDELTKVKNATKGLFIKNILQKKIDSIIKLFEIDLLEDTPDKEDKIPSELLPFVFEKLSVFLSKHALFLKEKIILSNIKPFVEAKDKENNLNQEKSLREEVESLKKDISSCPESSRFDQMRLELKAKLKEKEKSLLTLISGGEEALALDSFDGASQLY